MSEIYQRQRPYFGAVGRRASFLARNLSEARSIRPLPATRSGVIEVGSSHSSDFGSVCSLYEELTHSRLNLNLRLLLKTRIAALCVVARDPQIVGINIYYFKGPEDMKGAIHEGFIGVHPNHRGKGLSSLLREQAAAMYRAAGIEWITTKISQDNTPSLVGAQRCGFEIQQTLLESGTPRYLLARALK